MQRLSDLIKGIIGLAATAVLFVGLPLVLVRVVGSPLPTAWPGLDTISRHVTDGDIPDTFIIKLITIVVWIAWAQLTAATANEYVSILRGKASTRTPSLPGIRLFAAKLATWTTLIVSAIAPIRPAMATPLHSVPVTVVATQTLDPIPASSARLAPDESSSSLLTKGYRTARGDTWWDIAESLLGDGIRWNEIRGLNLDMRMADGEVITTRTDIVKPGWDLIVPAEARIVVSTEAALPAQVRTVTVERGDHFWAIAEDTLANEWGRQPTDAEITPYWRELVGANEDRLQPPEDPNLIYPDQTFLLPVPPRSPDVAVDLNGSAVLDTPPAQMEEPTPEPLPPAPEPVEDHASAPLASRAEVPTTTVESQAPEVSDAADGQGRLEHMVDEAKPIAVLVTGLAFLGATLLFTLRRLRHIQAARRRPDATIDPPDDEATEFEERIRAISTDGEDVRYLAAANSYLSHKLENAETPIPSIVAAMAGQFGLEFLLDDPCEPVEGFVASNNDKTAWRLRADIDVRMMEQATRDDAHPFAPALCVAGSTGSGAVLLDLEQLSTVSLEGDSSHIAEFQRGLIASACVAPWAGQCELVAIGIDGIAGEHLGRVSVPSEPNAWAERLAMKMTAVAKSLDRSPYEERVAHGDVYHPTVVFIGPDASLAGIAQHLAPVAHLAYAPLVVVAGQALAGEYRITLTDGEAMLEPFGLAFVPVGLPAEDLASVERLVANASETTSSPPATDWANEITVANHLATNGHRKPIGEGGDPNGSDEPDGFGTELGSIDAGPSQDAIDAIATILQPRPVEVRILGRQACIAGLDGDVTPKIKAIIAYMAFHREVVGQRLRDEFWPGSDSRQACDNAMVKARALLGLRPDGQQRLETVRSTSSYRIDDEVGLDWRRVEELIAASKGKSAADEAAYLDAACEFIDGHVAADARPDLYGWLLREPTNYTLIETTLVDAAHRRGQLALAAGDIERANWAAQKGLEIVEGQEAMYRMKMEAASEAGNIDGVNSAYRQAQRAAESYGYDEEVQPETQALFEKLAGSGQRSNHSESHGF